MKKASSIGLMQKRGGGVYSPNIESSKQMLFGISTRIMSSRGTAGNGDVRDPSKDNSNFSGNAKRGQELEIAGDRKRTKLLTGNFFSPNIERSKVKPSIYSPNLKSKDNGVQTQPRLYKFGTTEAYPQSAKILNLDACDGDNVLGSGRQEVWSGTCNLQNIGKSRGSSKVLSPQLMKSPVDNNILNYQSDNSYIKKVKQALLEKVGQSDLLNKDEGKLSPKSKEMDLLNLKKLKQITSGKNTLTNYNLQSDNRADGDSKDRLDLSGLGSKSNQRTPLIEKDVNSMGNQSGSKTLFSPQLMKQKQDTDTSDTSILSKNKSNTISKTSVAKGAAHFLSILQGKVANETEERKESASDYEKYLELSVENVKLSKLKMLGQTSETAYTIYNLISQDKDPYDTIRSYSDMAQEELFDKVKVFFGFTQDIFKMKQSRNLFARLIKLERWIVVYLFYFTIQESKKDKNKISMIDLAELLNKNVSFLVSYILRAMSLAEKNIEIYFKKVQINVAIEQAKVSTFIQMIDQHFQNVIEKLSSL